MDGPVELPNILNAQGHPENVRPKKGSTRLPSKETEDLPSRHPNMPLRLPSSSIIRADGRTTKSIGRDERAQSGAECGFKFKAQSVNPIRPRDGGGMAPQKKVTQLEPKWLRESSPCLTVVPGPAWILLYKI